MWSHKSFKARWPLRLFFGICHSIAGQNSIYEWCRDHRVHHKYSDTTADPHNINNGFFFAHMGWLCMEKHPDVKIKGQKIYMDDLKKDWVVRYQHDYFIPSYVLFTHILPTLLTFYYGDLNLIQSFHANLFRYLITLHITWCTNSFAHYVGYHPYDKNLKASEFRQFAWFAGEWWHNFHHAFPWDYKMSEQVHWELAFIWKLIDFFAYIGLAYDLKTVSQDMIKKRVLRTGDGTHPYSIMEKNNNREETSKQTKTNTHYWGWDDEDVTNSDKKLTEICNKHKEI
jgi:stearoyl-CoA desaturase (delta-9 desaturase)